jgi:hypothetical protein
MSVPHLKNRLVAYHLQDQSSKQLLNLNPLLNFSDQDHHAQLNLSYRALPMQEPLWERWNQVLEKTKEIA